MLEMKNVTVRYPGSSQDALKNISLKFDQEDFICILGKSGAGKSTFIRCINGLQTPASGEVYWDGMPMSEKNAEELRKVRREMGMIFQHFNLIPRLTVMQNVLTGTFGYRPTVKNLVGWFSKKEIQQAESVLADVGISELAERKVEHLSGGQKQRVGIARALVQQPRTLLGDEPVASLDPGTSNLIFTLLKQMHDRRNLLSVINVHDVHLAQRYATRILALRQGEIIFDGNPGDFGPKEYEETYGAEADREEFLSFNM